MKFHLKLTIDPDNRESVIRYFNAGGAETTDGVKLEGVWVAAQTGIGFMILSTDDGKALHQYISTWADVATIELTPIIEACEF